MGDAVSPAFAVDIAAMVAHRAQVVRGGSGHARPLFRRHPRFDAIGARHFRQHQRGERLAIAIGIVAVELAEQVRLQGAQAIAVELLAAHPVRQRFEGDAVAQLRIGIAQAVGQRERALVALRAIGHHEAGGLPSGEVRGCLSRQLAARLRWRRQATKAGEQQGGQQRAWAHRTVPSGRDDAV